jgi:hypothetical protein
MNRSRLRAEGYTDPEIDQMREVPEKDDRPYEVAKAATIAALGEALLQVLKELPEYPSDPRKLPSVEDDLRFAVRLTDSIANKLNKDDVDQKTALELLCRWQFAPSPNVLG